MRSSRRRDAELEALYRRHFTAFVRVASTLAGNVALGHEAVQEAFARAIEAQDRFRGEGTLEAWVWRIVVNTAKSSRETLLPEPHLVDVDFVSAQNGDGASAPVDAWVRSLPERQRLIVFLRYWADLDYRSIASVLEIEVGTVSATLSAAHRTLRRSLQEVPNDRR
jgi:RNA polymerase sigma-70 factor (ECF subfamily)